MSVQPERCYAVEQLKTLQKAVAELMQGMVIQRARVEKYKDTKLVNFGSLFIGQDKSSGHRRQKIGIYYKAAGIIDIADDLCEAGDGRGQWRRNRKTA